MEYPIVIVPLTKEDGGGFLGFVPDLKGCMSDGETREEALRNTLDAIAEWLDAAKVRKISIPAPGTAAARSRAQKAKFVQELKDLTKGIDYIEERLQEFERSMKEIEEKVENADAWSRFTELTGASQPKPGLMKPMV